MKMNKWTMALAAAGVVSLSSVAQAQEAAAGANALAASTTLSGYVSTSYTMIDGTSNAHTFRSGTDNDRFSMDVAQVSLGVDLDGRAEREDGAEWFFIRQESPFFAIQQAEIDIERVGLHVVDIPHLVLDAVRERLAAVSSSKAPLVLLEVVPDGTSRWFVGRWCGLDADGVISAADL